MNNFGVLQYPGTSVKEKPDRATLDVTTTAPGGFVTADPVAQATRLKLNGVSGLRYLPN